VTTFNYIRRNCILTSSDRVIDELMSAWRPQTSATGGLPNISYILWKPEPLGTEMKSIACPILKIMCYLEIQRGKAGMKSEPYNREFGATTGCSMRLAQGVSQTRVDDVAETLLANSWFGSVKSLCHMRRSEIGTKKEVIFQVKTNKKGFPKKYIEDNLKYAPGGSSMFLKATDPETGTEMIATGYKYNGRKVLFFVSTVGAGSTTNGEPYIVRYTDIHGNMMTQLVDCPQLVLIYFKKCNCVDVHNQLRQYSLRGWKRSG